MEGIESIKKLIICLIFSTVLLVSCIIEKESNTIEIKLYCSFLMHMKL